MSGAHLSGWPQPSRVMLEMLPGLGPPRSVFLNTLGFHGDSDGKESTCNLGDLGSIPGLGRSPGEKKGYSLQYSGLENSMDYIAHRVAKSQTWLSNFHFHLWFHWPLNTNTAWLLTGNSSPLEGISIDFPEKGGFHMSSGPPWRTSCVFSPQDKVTLRSTCQTQGTLLVLHISTSAIQSLSMD